MFLFFCHCRCRTMKTHRSTTTSFWELISERSVGSLPSHLFCQTRWHVFCFCLVSACMCVCVYVCLCIVASYLHTFWKLTLGHTFTAKGYVGRDSLRSDYAWAAFSEGTPELCSREWEWVVWEITQPSFSGSQKSSWDLHRHSQVKNPAGFWINH